MEVKFSQGQIRWALLRVALVSGGEGKVLTMACRLPFSLHLGQRGLADSQVDPGVPSSPRTGCPSSAGAGLGPQVKLEDLWHHPQGSAIPVHFEGGTGTPLMSTK